MTTVPLPCARCDMWVWPQRSEAEMWDEAPDRERPESLAQGTAIVCTDCYRLLMAWALREAPHLLREGVVEDLEKETNEK